MIQLPMHTRLVCTDAVTPVSEVVIDDAPIVFGRSINADIRLCDTWTSRFHCQLEVIDDELRVRDLGSSNGTLVNGETIDVATLSPGDSLTVGISTFELVIEDSELDSAINPALQHVGT